MALSDVFRKDPRIMATSSDGQKYGVAVPSLQSTYSLKYFGTKKGVSVYSFINDKYALFYNTVITASEREATYVMDGLLHHDIGFSIDGNAEEGAYGWHHSTDTHGFSETVFGLSHLLDITFAPRLKGYHKQRIYGFDSPFYYREKGYFWSPHRKIDTRDNRTGMEQHTTDGRFGQDEEGTCLHNLQAVELLLQTTSAL